MSGLTKNSSCLQLSFCSIFIGMLCLIGSSQGAVAQEPDVSTSNISSDGLPGFFRVGIPYTKAPRIAISGTGRYGIIESIGTIPGKHHELGGHLSVGTSIFPWFSASLAFDGKYQKHPSGGDFSALGSPLLKLRLGEKIKKSLLLGGELEAWFPGADAPSLEWRATTVTGKLLATIIKWTPFQIGATIGFRLDNSAKSAPNLNTLRPGDRISLDLSDHNALVTGIAFKYQLPKLAFILEYNAQLLLGEDARVSTSPMLLCAGARYQPISSLSFDLYTETALNKRPNIAPSQPLSPIPPRFAVFVGIRYMWNLFDSSTGKHKKTTKPKIIPETKNPDTPVPVIPQKTTGIISGQILDAESLPIADASVEIVVNDSTVTTRTDTDGNYTAPEVPVGTATVTITAQYFEPQTFEIEVQSGDNPINAPKKMVQSKVGSQLRGLVRNVAGEGIDADIVVLPNRIRTDTNNEGYFEIDVPPGTYTIEITARGYKKQKRSVTVGDNSVVILNVDLSEKR